MNRSAMGVVAVVIAVALGGCEKPPPPPDTLVFNNYPPGQEAKPQAAPAPAPDPGAAAPTPATPGPITKPAPPPAPPVAPPTKVVVKPGAGGERDAGTGGVKPVAHREAGPSKPDVGPPPPPASAQRTVMVRTVPSGAKVRLVANGTGQLFEGITPVTLSVPAGIYKWEVELVGYLTDKSVRNDVDVVVRRADTVVVALTPSGDVTSLLARANAAYNKPRGAGCEEAVRIYKQLPVPSDMRSAQGIQWMEGQYHAGQCQFQLREFDDAEAIFAAVLNRSPSQWDIKYELARTYCETKQYRKGIQHFRELGGPFTLSADIAPAVRTIARFGATECKYREYQSLDQPERSPNMRAEVVGGFEEFIDDAEPLLKGPFSAEMRKSLQEKIAKAKQALQKLDGGN